MSIRCTFSPDSLRLLIVVLWCAVWISSASGHPAQERLQPAVDAVIGSLFEANEPVADNADDRKVRVRAAVDAHLDFSVIVRRAFGRNWARLDASQQEEVVDLIIEALITGFVNNFSGSQPPQIEYGAVVEQGANRAEIPTSVTANGRSAEVVYRMGRLQSGWEVLDVVAEGVSMVANYRQQIDAHFRRGNAEGLLVRLRQMADRGEVDL